MKVLSSESATSHVGKTLGQLKKMKTTILLLLLFLNIVEESRDEKFQDYLETGWYEVSYDGSGKLMNLDRSNESYRIIPNPVFTRKDFAELYIYDTGFGTPENPNYGLALILKDELTEKWSDLTEKAIGKRLALIIDNQLIATPEVYSKIHYPTTAMNRLEYSKSDLEEFMKQIKNN